MTTFKKHKKLLGAAALVAALGVGGIGGAVLGAPSVSTAQEDPAPTTDPAPPADPGPPMDRGGREGCEGEEGRFGFRPGLDVAAETIGVTEEELRRSLRDGQTIAEVAEAEGVEVQTVIDALVEAATTRIDEAVADDRLGADRAEAIKAALPERITDLVNGEGPRHGRGGGRPRSLGRHAGPTR